MLHPLKVFLFLLRLLDLLPRHIHVDQQEILEDQFQHVVSHARAVADEGKEVVDVGDDFEARLLVVGKLDADLLAHLHWQHRHDVEDLPDEVVDELELPVELRSWIPRLPQLNVVI